MANSGTSSFQPRPKIFCAASSFSNSSVIAMMASPAFQKASSTSIPSALKPSISCRLPLFFASLALAFSMVSTSVSTNSAALCIFCRVSTSMPDFVDSVSSSSAHSVDPFALARIFFPRFTAAFAPRSRLSVIFCSPLVTFSQLTPFPMPASSFPALSAPVSTFFSAVSVSIRPLFASMTFRCMTWKAADAGDTPFFLMLSSAACAVSSTFCCSSSLPFRISAFFCR